MSELYYLEVDDVRVETDKALLCVVNGEEYWIPKSMIKEGDLSRGESGEIAIPLWLAEEKGL